MPVLTIVSHATRLRGSFASSASRTESLIRSDTLSGCPSDTDSEVNRYFFAVIGLLLTFTDTKNSFPPTKNNAAREAQLLDVRFFNLAATQPDLGAPAPGRWRRER